VIVATVQKVFAEAKLGGSPEISVIRSSFQPVPGDWIICLRSNAPDRPVRYAIFFQNGEYLSSRIAITADQCGEQAYVPAPSPESSTSTDNSAPAGRSASGKKARP
jgi:hypothetical protein